ncbi:cytochrome P450 [Halalkalicoccus subterraneus]|uniref:cytochrome P450 n=1 Tax=Halalkalicoccus subterraneus TaxID=2675002 RepID=UPI000EFD6269|nr:cytochrome P450 [Halalkalicoccus subterraneus]
MDPFPWYETMRETKPVRYDERRECWDLFRYEDVKRTLSDYETFTSTGASDFDPNGNLGTLLIDEDPPEHDRLRGVVEEYFRPGNLRGLRPSIRSIVDDRLDQALEDGNEIDAISELTAPVTISTISRLLGVPEDDWDLVRQWSSTMISDESGRDAIMEGIGKMYEYFSGLLEDRRRNPESDLISVIAGSESVGEPTLSPSEQRAFCVFLFLAGHSTTTHAVGNALWTLEETGEYERLRDGELDWQMMFNEVLRYRGPVQSISGRRTTEVVELNGTEIPKGERVVSWIGSANRDPAVFDDPEEFYPTRTPNRHIAFGFGPHYCLGAPLAKLEGDVILDAVTDHVERLEVDEGPSESVELATSYGFDRLPMTFHPRS